MIEKSAILSLAGDIDLAHEGAVRELLESVDAGELVVLDLSGVRFVDSTGVRLLLAYTERVRPARVVVVGAKPSIRQIFKTTGVESAFSFEEAR